MNQVAVYQKPPAGITSRQSQALLNNQLASAYATADPRYNAKQYDRAGVSRGAGQMAQAGIDAAKNLSEGIAQAYSQQLQNRQYNADVGLQGQVGRETWAQALGGLQEQNNYANQMAALQRQQTQNSLLSGLIGGLFN